MEKIKYLLEFADYYNITFNNLPDWLVDVACLGQQQETLVSKPFRGVDEDFCIRAIRTDIKYFFKIPKELLTEKVCLEALVSFNEDDDRFTLEDIHNYMPEPIET